MLQAAAVPRDPGHADWASSGSDLITIDTLVLESPADKNSAECYVSASVTFQLGTTDHAMWAPPLPQ